MRLKRKQLIKMSTKGLLILEINFKNKNKLNLNKIEIYACNKIINNCLIVIILIKNKWK